ncbi:MAG: flagellar filament capping protein FliD [Planctomycetota bacterium]|jgi:flagellar hook-associated protein 2
MSGISSTVGLISGLPTADLISQLMALEARPMAQLQARVAGIQARRTAFVDLSARLVGLKSRVQRFSDPTFFRVFAANSSNPSVLTATAGENASAGSFSFTVRSLVSSHALIGAGYTDADTIPVGAGTLIFENGQARLNEPTTLEALNGGRGVRRGRIQITDRAGNTAEIDLTVALTVDDVLEAVNSQTVINVRARASGDRIVVDDLNDSAVAGNLTVSDLTGGHAAEDLGIAQSIAATAGQTLALNGDDIVNLADSTLLSSLNDGNGVGRARAGTDFTIARDDGAIFEISLSGNIGETTRLEVLNSGNGVRLGVIRITDRSGNSTDIDLAGAANLGDVIESIEQQSATAGLDIDATFFNSSTKHALQFSDGSGGEGAFKIEDVSGFAARDLGIAVEIEDDSIIGNGIHRITTVGDVMRAIRYAYDEQAQQYNEGRVPVVMTSNGNGLQLIGQGFPSGFEVIAGDDSTAAADLGILGRYENGVPPQGAARDLIAGLNTVLLRSLNGGAGVNAGNIEINGVEIDLSGGSPIHTLQDVIDRINEKTELTGVSAAINPVSHGIILQHELGSGFSVNDLAGGTLAADLNISGSHSTGQVDSGSLQKQYVSGQTLLSDLNNGRGIRTGEFRIADASGGVHIVNVTENQQTVGDILALINAGGGSIVASINATGDGIRITDNSGGTGQLTIEDSDGGFAASDLNIAGQAAEDENVIDGSFEVHIDVDADDTLQDVAAKINAVGGDFSASVINDGTSTAPYRLTISSLVSGLRGRLLFDGGDTGLTVDTLVEPRDAVVFLGGADADNPLILRSPTNTLNDVLNDVTIDLVGVSDERVDLSIAQDVDAIVEDLRGFVDAYNEVMDRIDAHTDFNTETFERGVLFGDGTVSLIENRLFRSVTRAFEDAAPGVSRLSAIGIEVAPDTGGRLRVDESEFREVYADNPEAVEQLFTAEETGFGVVFEEMLDDLSRSFDGLLARKDSTLEGQEDLLTDRIELMQELLDRKQARLERQFQALESSLAALQSQQSALGVLQDIVGGVR